MLSLYWDAHLEKTPQPPTIMVTFVSWVHDTGLILTSGKHMVAWKPGDMCYVRRNKLNDYFNCICECFFIWVTSNMPWWCNQMDTFFVLLPFYEGNLLVTGGFHHKGHWRGALMLSLICTCTNGWANNRDTDDSRRYHSHYGVTVMV